MRVGFEEIINQEHISAKWLFECGGHHWTFGDPLTFNNANYESKIITDSFSGITENVSKAADKQIAPNTTSFAVAGEKTEFNPVGFVGSDLKIRLLIDGVEKAAWLFYVKSCYYSYGQFNFTCEDFLQKYLFNSEFPNTELLNGFNNTTATFAGKDNVCIPEVYGTAYAPLRPIPHEGEWLYVLGRESDYTINKIASPIEFDFKSEYEPPDHLFTQSTVNGLQVFANDIGTDGANSPFLYSGKICDLPTLFSKAATEMMTSPADIIADILQKLGIQGHIIDVNGTFAASKSLFESQGLSFNVAYTTREDAIKVLCELLVACNSRLLRTDKVLLVAQDDIPVKSLTRQHIKDLSFNGNTFDDDYDGGYVQYYPDIQAGEPTEIPVAIDGASYSNISSDKLLLPYLIDTQALQRVGIVYYRRKFLQTGTLSFSSNFSLLDLVPGDRVSISDDLYQDYNIAYVGSVDIKPDLSLQFSLDVYGEAIGSLNTFSPPEIGLVANNTPGITPLSERWLKSIYMRSGSVPDTPTGDNPADWTDEIPSGPGLLYESVRWFGNDGKPLNGSAWSEPVQKEGAEGEPGAKGDTGPGVTYAGEWSSTKQYYSTSVKRDVVKSGNNHYACKVTHVNISVSNTSYWEAIPDFSSIATGILLADDATILRNLIIGASGYDCGVRSGLTGPTDTSNTGFYIGRHGGDTVMSLRSADGSGVKVDKDGTEISGKLIIKPNSTGIRNLTDAGALARQDNINLSSNQITNKSLANLDSAANNKLSGIQSGADKTTVTTMQNALNGQAMITTGRIRDGNSNLLIDFDAAAITVKKSSGLLIKSGGGVTVQSGGGITVESGGNIKVNEGGDIELLSVVGNPSKLKFGNSEAAMIGEIYAYPKKGYKAMVLKPSDTDSILIIGSTPMEDSRWESVAIDSKYYSSNSQYRSVMATGKADSWYSHIWSTITSSVASTTILAQSGGVNRHYSSIQVRAADDSSSLQLLNKYGSSTAPKYHKIKMIHGLEVHTSLRTMNINNNPTIYDHLIPGVGDFYFWSYVDGAPHFRFRDSNGNCRHGRL